MKKNVQLICISIVIVAMYGCANPVNTEFNTLAAPEYKNTKGVFLTREVILKDQSGFVPEPHAMTRTSDGGFLIAGSLGRAWAIKIDAAGKLIWRYWKDEPLTNGGFTTDYNGAVAMPDGSAYLCGNTSLKGKGYTPAILTHLNSAGQLIKEQLFVPQAGTAAGLGYFDNCFQWGENLMLVGHIFQFNDKKFGEHRESHYWFIMLDATGKIKWEKQIPTTLNMIMGTQSILLAPSSSMVIAGHKSGETELFHISEAGELIAKKWPMNSDFRFVQSVAADGILQHYRFNQTDKSYELITFNDQFEEVQRAQVSQELNFGGRFIYRMPDQSLVLFGGARHTRGKSAVGHIDSKLQSLQTVDLFVDAKIYESKPIDVAEPAEKNGEFVAVKQLFKHRPDERLKGYEHFGLALYFVQIK